MNAIITNSKKELLLECVHVDAWSALVLILTVRRKTDLINENDIVVSTACIDKWPERERGEGGREARGERIRREARRREKRQRELKKEWLKLYMSL